MDEPLIGFDGSMQSHDLSRSGNRGMSHHSNDKPAKTRRSHWPSIFLFVAVAAIISGLAWLVTPRRLTSQSPAIGKTAPLIDLVRLSDNGIDGSMDSRPNRKVVLLHCWATWCPPCRHEYPNLSKLANRFGDTGQFVFIPVSCESVGGETFEGLWSKTKTYFDSRGIDGVAYADPRGMTRRSIAERLERDSLYFPTSLLIDEAGTIVGVWEGVASSTLSEIEAAVTELVST